MSQQFKVKPGAFGKTTSAYGEVVDTIRLANKTAQTHLFALQVQKALEVEALAQSTGKSLAQLKELVKATQDIVNDVLED